MRWQEFVGTGELLKSLEAKVGRLRDRMVNAIKGKPQQAERVNVAVESSLETLILEHAEAAAERAEASWRSLAPGQELLSDVGEDLGRASRGLRRAGRAARCATGSRTCWRWSAPRAPTSGPPPGSWPTASTGSRSSLMVVVFANTAGITGAEVGIAGGSALLGQKLLEAVFGDQAAPRASPSGRAGSSRSRVRALLDEERHRYLDLLASLGIDPEAAEQLRNAARAVDDLRYASVERSGTHSH